MRVFLFVFLVLSPLAAVAAPGDSVETRLRLLEQKLESQKDDAKTEAGRVENRFLDRIGHLELTVSQQNSHMDQVLSQLNLSIAVGGLALALAALIGGWKAVQVAKGEARDALREMLGEIEMARAEVQALLKDARQGHREIMSKAAELKNANIAPSDYTPDQQATIAAAAEKAAAKPEAERTEIDLWAMAQQAMLTGHSSEAAQHLAEADENKPWTWVLRARVFRSQGDWENVGRAGQKALELSRRNNDLWQEALAQECLQEFYSYKGEEELALEALENSLAIRRKIVSTDGDVGARKNLAVSLRRLSAYYVGRGDVSPAMSCAEEAIKICGDLYKSHPDDDEIIDGLAKSYDAVGFVQYTMNDWDEAKHSYQESMRLRDLILSKDPDNMHCRHGVAIDWNRLGLIAREQHDWPLAKDCAMEFLVLMEQLASHDFKNVRWVMDTAYARRDVADCDLYLGFKNSAKSGYQAAVKRLQSLETRDLLDSEGRRFLDDCREKLKSM